MSENEAIQFFGKIDKGSTYPAWSLPAAIDEMEEEISLKERQLERGQIKPERIPMVKAQIEAKKDRLRNILESKPKLNPGQATYLEKLCKDLGEEIGRSMFTRSDMEKGTADAHEEAKRMSEPCISVPRELAAQFGIAQAGGSGQNMLVSRDNASRIWQTGRRYFGRPSNIEELRKD